MRFGEKLNVIFRMIQHIRMKATGKPEDFASRLSISRATLFRYLDAIRATGAMIHSDDLKQTYFFGNNFKIW